MTIRAWRIVKSKLAARAFTGEGARLYGGRWNSPGQTVVYAAGSASLAMLEMLVHLPSRELLHRYVLFELTFDEALVSLCPANLSKKWRMSPSPRSNQRMGDEWIATGRSAVLRVPSVIVSSEWNYLLNPSHPDFVKIAIGPKQPLRFDPRLIK